MIDSQNSSKSQENTWMATNYSVISDLDSHIICNTIDSTTGHEPSLNLGELAPINANKVRLHFSEHEYFSILAQHQTLSSKMFESGLSAEEERMRAYLRWQLDRIEMADSRPLLDKLWQEVRELHAAKL